MGRDGNWVVNVAIAVYPPRVLDLPSAQIQVEATSTRTHSPGYSSAEEPKSTQSPVSKLADLHVAFLRHSSMQSVSMRVPGLESSMSSGAV